MSNCLTYLGRYTTSYWLGIQRDVCKHEPCLIYELNSRSKLIKVKYVPIYVVSMN